MVGSDARTLLSLVISCPPAPNGTLKSTRMKTALSFRFKSRTEIFGIRSILSFFQEDANRLPNRLRRFESRLQLARLLKPERVGGGPTSVQQRDRVPPNCALCCEVNPSHLE